MKALIALNEVLQIDPELAEAKALTAEALAVNGENEMAFQAFREALDTSLTEDKGWFERLILWFRHRCQPDRQARSCHCGITGSRAGKS